MESEMQVKKLLFQRLEIGLPALFLGAGFSCKAKNAHGKELPLAKSLCEELFQTFFSPKATKGISQDDIDYAEEKKAERNLGALCSLIRSEKRGTQLVQFLTDRFSGCRPAPFHKDLLTIHWDIIYTLNIDDVVENVYSEAGQPLLVQNNDKQLPNRENRPQLFKLHGCVTKPALGYTFSLQEYAENVSAADYRLTSFGNTCLNKDVIFVGTELDETDILYIIRDFLRKGYTNEGHEYFFVSPSLNPMLKNEIANTRNFHFIMEDTETFLKDLVLNYKERSMQEELILSLGEKGLIDIQKINDKLSPYYESELYYGKESRYNDFLGQWDIAYPDVDNWVNSIITDGNNTVCSLYGKSFVGKTCVARHILISFFKKGFRAFEFPLKSDEYQNLICRYLAILPSGSKVAIFIDDSAYQYQRIDRIISNKKTLNLSQLVIITADHITFHEQKSHLLSGKYVAVSHEIKETISNRYANNIYKKLREKHRLGKLQTYANTQESQIKFIREKNDIIEVLYCATQGTSYVAHFSDVLSNIEETSQYFPFFSGLCILKILGVHSMLGRLLPNLHPQLPFNWEKFTSDFAEVISVRGAYVRVRCFRMIQKVIENKIDMEEKRQILYNVILAILPNFNEQVDNEWSEIFEKVASTRVVLKEKVLNPDELSELFTSLENECAELSFYWIQRGILALRRKQFEPALSFLKNAENIQPNSYQVKHALAKNNMEWGLWLYKNNPFEAVHLFELGAADMRKLIESRRYSRALQFSIHAYTDLNLKWLQKRNEVMSLDLAEFISEYLLKAVSMSVDSIMKEVIERFAEQCHKDGIRYPVELDSYRSMSVSKRNREDYDIDALSRF